MTNIPTNYFSFRPMVSRVSKDAQMLPVLDIDFTIDTQYQIDLTATVQSAQLEHTIQSVYLDCATCASSTILQVFGSGQQIVVPAGSQGYFPIICMRDSFVFTMSNFGGIGQPAGIVSILNMFFLNIPMVAQVWYPYGGYGTGPLGNQPLGS